MFKKIRKILVTGGAGFIGSEFVRLSTKFGYKVIVLDKLTYAGDLERLKSVKGKYKFYKVDVCDAKRVVGILKKEKPEVVVNFAAETHVDRSIKDSSAFLETNIKGVRVLLEASRRNNIGKFIHISTDEVYGEIKRGKFKEDCNFCPNSPYAASKAAADLFIRSYIRTYDFPALIIRPSNNYGPWQYPEKLIPLTLSKLLRNEQAPVYGRGQNVREWLHVSDCARAVLLILQKGKRGGIYNIGSADEEKNINVVKRIVGILGKSDRSIKFVKDRPGHDWRYALDAGKLRRELGWRPKIGFQEGLKDTVQWYKLNRKWLEKCLKKSFTE